MTAPSFESYLKTLAPVSAHPVAAEPQALDLCIRATSALDAAAPVDAPKLAQIVAADPAIVPVLAAAVGFSQERLRTWLQGRFATAGWVQLGRTRSRELIEALDKDFGLVSVLGTQMEREWTWADVLARVMAPRQRAGDAVQQGRELEDAVQDVLERLRLPYLPRTRFEGTGGQTAPADFAIPSDGADALIAIGVKGFDSTGSKLGDAMREIEEMAKVRRPMQFIFVVADGHGWLRRQNDLRRIHGLWTANRVDGVYTQATLSDFSDAVAAAARRLDLI